MMNPKSDSVESSLRGKRVLYIQHAGSLGGSVMSLLYTMQGLRERHGIVPVVALIRPAPELLELYRKHGIETHARPGIRTIEHTTLAWGALHTPRILIDLIRSLLTLGKSGRLTMAAVKELRPDFVHLNSVVLVPCAMALASEGFPFVWHVREPPVRGYCGLRLAWISKLLRKLTPHTIFISDYDRDSWTGGVAGDVVRNFVDFSKFVPTGRAEELRRSLNLRVDQPVLCYLGGLSEVKGVFVLLKALALLRRTHPDAVCLMFGCSHAPAASWRGKLARAILPRIGCPPVTVKFFRLVERLGLSKELRLMGTDSDIAKWIEASDVVLFPSVLPHFARPVVEAGAMSRPVVGSDLGGVTELVVPGKTGVLVPARSPEALARGIAILLDDPAKAREMGRAAKRHALECFSADKQIDKIALVYHQLLKSDE